MTKPPAPLTCSPIAGLLALSMFSIGCQPPPPQDERLETAVSGLAGCTQPGGPSLVAGPWITNVTSTSATVMFQAGGNVPTSVLFMEDQGSCSEENLYTQGEKVTASVVTQPNVPYSQEDNRIPEHLYSATLNLPATGYADRRYCYGLEFEPNPFAPQNRYFCEPDPADGYAGTSFTVPGAQRNRFSFYVYGDTRDPSGFNQVHQEVVEEIVEDMAADLSSNRPAAGFLINTGDFAYFGCDEGLWLTNFFAPTRPLLQQLPIFTAPGNHEAYDEQGGPECPRASYYFANFGEPYRSQGAHAPGMYSVDYKNVRLISLNITDSGCQKDDTGQCTNQQNYTGGLDPGDCQKGKPCGYEWLKSQLLGEGSSDWDAIDHIFVFYHAPLITAPPQGKHASSPFQIQQLAPLFERPDGDNPGKVTAVLTGHNHFYERSLPITNLCLESDQRCRGKNDPPCPTTPTPHGFSFPPLCYSMDTQSGIHYVISGGGGATPYQAPDGPFPIQWLGMASDAYHYVKITIDEKRAELEAKGFHADGSPFRDRAVLRGRPGL